MLNKIILILTLAAAPAYGTLLTVPNGGALTGTPGDTVGWDFQLTSETVVWNGTNIIPWLLISAAEFVLDSGVMPVGVFTPYVTQPANFAVIGPDTGNGEVNPFAQTFSAALQTGLAEYAINPFQSPGDLATGYLVVTFDEYAMSPNDPAFDPSSLIAPGLQVSTRASVTVTPEPGALAMVAIGLLALAAKYRPR